MSVIVFRLFFFLQFHCFLSVFLSLLSSLWNYQEQKTRAVKNTTKITEEVLLENFNKKLIKTIFNWHLFTNYKFILK